MHVSRFVCMYVCMYVYPRGHLAPPKGASCPTYGARCPIKDYFFKRILYLAHFEYIQNPTFMGCVFDKLRSDETTYFQVA